MNGLFVAATAAEVAVAVPLAVAFHRWTPRRALARVCAATAAGCSAVAGSGLVWLLATGVVSA